MNIEWWMIDLCVCLIVMFAAMVGAFRGIGDTVLRILGIAGGLFLGTMYSAKVNAWLMTTKVSSTLHSHIFDLLRSGGEGSEDGSSPVIDLFFSDKATDDTANSPLSKSLGEVFDSAADRAADAMADKLTGIALNIISYALIVLAVGLLVMLLRALIRYLRKGSLVLGFTDRVLGLVLGGIRGLMIAWIAVALLIPVTTIFSPENVGVMLDQLQMTTFAKVLYDVNPFLMIIKYALGGF